LCAAAIVAACSATSNNQFGEDAGSKNGDDGTLKEDVVNDTLDVDDGDSNDTGFDIPDQDNDVPPTCNPKADPSLDQDGDGYSPNDGDCNDCNPTINPGAFDVPGNGIDDDCDGTIDNEVTVCDADFAINDPDPMHGAHAIELCRTTTHDAVGKDKTWGVLYARYVKADGTPGMNPIGRGLLPQFGVVDVLKGNRMLVLSSGTARAPGQPGYESPSGKSHDTTGSPPKGYPKESPACPGVITGSCNDPAALELYIRVPTNARSFSFNFNFFTYEFPTFVCSTYNDFFVTMLFPEPKDLPDGNISFDSKGNPISVNNALLQVCETQTIKTKHFPCELGVASLEGTGFDAPAPGALSHAATGWLVTHAPVEPGSIITLRFAIWDSGDHILDSTVLIDNFQWGTETVSDYVTEPIPH